MIAPKEYAYRIVDLLIERVLDGGYPEDSFKAFCRAIHEYQSSEDLQTIEQMNDLIELAKKNTLEVDCRAESVTMKGL